MHLNFPVYYLKILSPSVCACVIAVHKQDSKVNFYSCVMHVYPWLPFCLYLFTLYHNPTLVTHFMLSETRHVHLRSFFAHGNTAFAYDAIT